MCLVEHDDAIWIGELVKGVTHAIVHRLQWIQAGWTKLLRKGAQGEGRLSVERLALDPLLEISKIRCSLAITLPIAAQLFKDF
jgi:hypothetical protein